MTKLFYTLSILGALLSATFYYLSSSKNNETTTEIENLKSQLSFAQSKQAKINSEKEQLAQDIASKNDAYNETLSENTVLAARINQLKRENHRFTEELDTRIETEEKLQRELADLNNTLADLKDSSVSIDSLVQYEGRITELETENLRLRDSQRRFPGTASNAKDSSPTPADLKGNILTVGPGASFVVIDLGYTDGIRLANSLDIIRGSRPIAKIQVTDVKENLSIARILPESLQIEPQTGDSVASFN